MTKESELFKPQIVHACVHLAIASWSALAASWLISTDYQVVRRSWPHIAAHNFSGYYLIGSNPLLYSFKSGLCAVPSNQNDNDGQLLLVDLSRFSDLFMSRWSVKWIWMTTVPSLTLISSMEWASSMVLKSKSFYCKYCLTFPCL